MSPYLVLVVDDDPAILRLLRRELTADGYRITTSDRGEDALPLVEAERPDLVVLEIHLAGFDGLTALQQIRERWQIPVIMLSASASGRELIAALNLGADNYVAKPFNTEEFLAHVRALLRRSTAAPGPSRNNLVDLGGVVIDLDQHRLLVAGHEVHLNRTEWQLLYRLATNVGRVMAHRELLAKVWGPEFVDDVQYLHVWVSRLRRKIGDRPDNSRYLVTIPGVGYRLQPGATPTATAIPPLLSERDCADHTRPQASTARPFAGPVVDRVEVDQPDLSAAAGLPFEGGREDVLPPLSLAAALRSRREKGSQGPA